MKKVRPDAVLKLAPDGIQEDVYDFMATHSYAATVEHCRDEHELDVSPRMLSEFREWYPVQKQLEDARNISEDLVEFVRANPDLRLDDNRLSQLGQTIFEAMAIKRRDPKLFLGLRRWRIAERNVELEMRKYRDSVKTANEKAIDQFMAEVRGDPVAVELVRKLQQRIATAMEEAA